MSDVFLSYSRADRALAEPIKDRLEHLGLDVFYDVEGGVDAGDAFPIAIGDAIAETKAVLALWTPHALTRDWCRKEGHLASQLGKLVPAALTHVSAGDLREFTATSYESLADFDGQQQHFGWSQVLFAIAKRMDEWAQANAGHADAVAAIERAARVRQAALAARPPAGAPSAIGQTGAAAAWDKIDKSDPADLRHFAETFPGTSEALEARRLAARVEQDRQARQLADQTAAAQAAESARAEASARFRRDNSLKNIRGCFLFLGLMLAALVLIGLSLASLAR